MRRYYHPGEFRERFTHLIDEYENKYRPEIERIRNKFASELIPPEIDDSLEYHARIYSVNGFFEALNWPLLDEDNSPKIIPEAQLRSLTRGTTRFLDYFGFSITSNLPLMVIEAKRKSFCLPQVENLRIQLATQPSEDVLGKEWFEIINTLKDYVISVENRFGISPRRVVITNSDWLIIFLDPKGFFVLENHDADNIQIYFSRDQIIENAEEIWNYLEYDNVVGNFETRTLNLGELQFRVDTKQIKKIMFGILLIYYQYPTQQRIVPQINILPIILISSHSNIWIQVHGAEHEGFLIPHDYNAINDHIREVQSYGDLLFSEVKRILNYDGSLSDINSHYEQDDSNFMKLRSVTEILKKNSNNTRYFILVTGNNSHFIHEFQNEENCIFHSWKQCMENGVAANDNPIMLSSISRPKSFFREGENHHCSHAYVFSAKSSQITEDNKQRCGLRSGPVFCEIINIEEHLCCKSCIYFQICSKTEIFRLPCMN